MLRPLKPEYLYELSYEQSAAQLHLMALPAEWDGAYNWIRIALAQVPLRPWGIPAQGLTPHAGRRSAPLPPGGGPDAGAHRVLDAAQARTQG